MNQSFGSKKSTSLNSSKYRYQTQNYRDTFDGNDTFFLISDGKPDHFDSKSSSKKKTFIRKPKKKPELPIDPGISTIKSFLNDETFPYEIDNPSDHIQSYPKKEPLISDEEERLLLTPSKKRISQESMEQQASLNSGKEKASAYFLMFCNICRSFIAIGVLAIPYGLSKSGNPKLLTRRHSPGLWLHNTDHSGQYYQFQLSRSHLQCAGTQQHVSRESGLSHLGRLGASSGAFFDLVRPNLRFYRGISADE